MEEEFNQIYYISALYKKHLKPLLERIFQLLPEQKEQIESVNSAGYPILNLDSKTFIAELIREKIFLMTGDELPYTATVMVDEITERGPELTYIKAKILTTDDRYKKMFIGKGGRKIKEIGSYARKEIALATGKKIYLDLTIKTDPHWQETYY
jgi:GTP-binding protein Era